VTSGFGWPGDSNSRGSCAGRRLGASTVVDATDSKRYGNVEASKHKFFPADRRAFVEFVSRRSTRAARPRSIAIHSFTVHAREVLSFHGLARDDQ
jgi:hypothetical protein